ncbi:Spy/CpxP family protein refolding chaperone [Edaphobacter aggregans]|uniref:Spy/CpxP family protein refolding chaperone n=1 Tax=Edaphobacter aggregans TaxID=570835 RepID=UPI00055958E6|nr:Spy/CpxP family protein refolding chaperone [Edaphobacter aggregans]
MTRHHLLTLASLSLLCTSSALAQTTSTAPAPPPPPDGPAPRAHAKTVRDVQYRVVTPGVPGSRADLRIAPPGIWWKNPDIIQKLSLTADQQKRMDDIFQQSRIQLIDLKANVEKQEVMLEPMLSANPPDTNKVLAQIDHVASARAELEKANARMLLGIRGVLSADQWTKLQAEQRENRRMMFKFQPGPGGPGGPGGPDMMFKGPKGPGGPESFRGPGLSIERGLSVGPHGPLSMLELPPLPSGDSIGVFSEEPGVTIDLLDSAPDDDLDL